VEKLNSDALAARVSEVTKEWLNPQLETMRLTGESLGSALASLSDELRREMRQTIQEPMREQRSHVIALLQALPKEVFHLCRDATSKSASDTESKLAELRRLLGRSVEQQARQVIELKQSIVDCARRVQKVAEDVMRVSKEGKERKAEMQSLFSDQVPKTVKVAMSDALRDIEREQVHVSAALRGAVESLVKLEGGMVESRGSLSVVQRVVDDSVNRLEALAQQVTVAQTRRACAHTGRGQEGESALFQLLSDRLRTKDGYEVEMCNGVAHQCDIRVKRLNYPEVRIESKAIGSQTGEKVRYRDVAKFQSDLLGLNTHGIFVSLHAGIVGKSDLEVELLSNNKFAVYLANNNYNMDTILDMFQLIYRLDQVLTRADGSTDDPSIRVSPEAAKRIGMYIKDFGSKISAAKNHMKESLSLLSEITLEMIEKVLLGQVVSSVAPVSAAVSVVQTVQNDVGVACQQCGQTFKGQAGLASHMRSKHSVTSARGTE
jgi:hypothetical protein